MHWYRTVWRNCKLIGIVLPRAEGIAVYSVEDLKNSELFLNGYGIETIRDNQGNLVGVKGQDANSPTAYNEINAPEIVMIF